MSQVFSPELQQVIDERMAAGHYASTNELLLEALLVLRQVEVSHDALRAEIQERLDRRGKAPAEPLDFEGLKAELHSNFKPAS
jgi:Arc/MetJ-type ribon-helix-helix transcriptional regulator